VADLVITAANVVAGTNAVVNRSYNAGATITAGQAVYLDSTTSTWKLGDANAAAPANTVQGVALHGASSGQPLAVQTAGPITIGATVAVGTIYVLSATPGGIAPHGDLVSTWYTNVIGVGISATQIQLNIINSGVAVP
jgi:hypothetical protein